MADEHTDRHDTRNDPSRPSEEPPSSPRCVRLLSTCCSVYIFSSCLSSIDLCTIDPRGVCNSERAVPPRTRASVGPSPTPQSYRRSPATLSRTDLCQYVPTPNSPQSRSSRRAHAHTRQLSAFASEENYIIIIVIIILCVIMPVMPIHAGATPESPAGFLPRTSKPR